MKTTLASPIERLGIVGAGQMGAGIAQVAAVAGFDVLLTDIDDAGLERALESITNDLDRLHEKGDLNQDEIAAALKRITTSTHLKEHSRCDLVIESAIEDCDIKRGILQQLDDVCSAGVVLATNTSSLSIARLASATSRPDRVVGMHFMLPVPRMELIEIVCGLETSAQTRDLVFDLAGRLDKTPVECRDFPGFVSNRLLIPMINEAVFAVYEGIASIESVDKIMQLGMNHPMGPLRLADLIGLDTCVTVMRMLHDGMGDPKYRPCPLLVKMVEAGRLGRKCGRGFYDYPSG
ncbi:MAG: 3-hydroxybutyryl-CoA dehydrogenase [Acidobacteriota bacterium]